jgi:hypothetical protein
MRQIGATKGLFREGFQNTPHLERSPRIRLLRNNGIAPAI